jgi:hypothetical protein
VRYARLLSGVRRRQGRPGAAGGEMLKVLTSHTRKPKA